jgi:hypothetical protein
MSNKNGWDQDEMSSSAYLLKRLEDDMQAVHTQMEVLQIVFDNLKSSWLGISLAHKAFKVHRED